MDRRKRWITRKLNTTIERFVLWASPRQRLADIYDIIDNPPPAYALHMLYCTARAIQELAIQPILFPGINVHCGFRDPNEKQQLFANVPRALRRSFLLFALLFSWYAIVVDDPLILFVDIPSRSGWVLILMFVLALPLQRRTLLPPLPKESLEFKSFLDKNYRKALLRNRDMLPMAEFRPSKSLARAGTLALMILLVLFAAAYPLIRWIADGSLPPGVPPENTLGLALVALVVVAWFLLFFKASRIAAKAFDDELKRIPI